MGVSVGDASAEPTEVMFLLDRATRMRIAVALATAWHFQRSSATRFPREYASDLSVEGATGDFSLSWRGSDTCVFTKPNGAVSVRGPSTWSSRCRRASSTYRSDCSLEHPRSVRWSETRRSLPKSASSS